jgi:hypothetical protein
LLCKWQFAGWQIASAASVERILNCVYIEDLRPTELIIIIKKFYSFLLRTLKSLLYSHISNKEGKGAPTIAGARVLPVLPRQVRQVARTGRGPTATQGRTAQEIVKEANAAIGTNAIAAARRLPSGDTILTFHERESKAKWEGNPKLLKVFGAEAKFRTKEWTVLAHGVQMEITLYLDDQTRAIAEIYCQNPRLEGRVKIVRVGRAKKGAGKQFAPLYIGIAELEQAKYLIEQGLILGSVLHNCEPFFKECRVTQCINCQGYGHIARYSTKVAQCGFCATLGHCSKDCTKQEDRNAHKCALCKANHTAWAR